MAKANSTRPPRSARINSESVTRDLIQQAQNAFTYLHALSAASASLIEGDDYGNAYVLNNQMAEMCRKMVDVTDFVNISLTVKGGAA